MKNIKTKTIFVIASISICILSVICNVLVCNSKLPYMTKYSMITLLLGSLCVLLFMVTTFFENISKQFNEKSLSKKERELSALKQQLNEKQNQIVSLNKKIADLSTPKTTDGIDLLKKKCAEIENFRNSFPYKIADGYILYNVIRTELKVSAYSRWQLVGEYNGQLWEYSLLRPDVQAYSEMLILVSSTSSPQELETLDISTQLLWD